MRIIQRMVLVTRSSKHWLYKLGNEFTALTGGWQARAWSGNGSIWSHTAPGLTKNADNMVASMPHSYSAGKSGVVEILNNIDLTPYTTLRVKLNLAIGGCSAVAGADGYQRIYLVCAADRTYTNGWTSSAIYKAIAQVFAHTSISAFNASDVVYTLDVSGVNQAVDVFLGLVWKQQAAGSTIAVLEVELI